MRPWFSSLYGTTHLDDPTPPRIRSAITAGSFWFDTERPKARKLEPNQNRALATVRRKASQPSFFWPTDAFTGPLCKAHVHAVDGSGGHLCWDSSEDGGLQKKARTACEWHSQLDDSIANTPVTVSLRVWKIFAKQRLLAFVLHEPIFKTENPSQTCAPQGVRPFSEPSGNMPILRGTKNGSEFRAHF